MDVVRINWEKKKELVESGEIDCIMGCFSMEGRLDDYRWAPRAMPLIPTYTFLFVEIEERY